jgi:uncharacterized protein (DUF2267 family)
LYTQEEVRDVDELVKLVSERTGISEEMARTAVETVIGYLKERLPEPIAGRIEGLLEGGDLEDMVKGLGGLLG